MPEGRIKNQEVVHEGKMMGQGFGINPLFFSIARCSING